MTVQLPALPRLPVGYVDPSPSGRAAFRATHAASLRVHAAAPEDVREGERVVLIRDRGGPATREALERLAGRVRLLVVDRAGVPDAELWCAAGLAEQVLVMPAPPSAVVRMVRAAWREEATRREAALLLEGLIARDRAACVAALRGKLLHDLANLATAASMDAELLRSAARDDADVEEIVGVCARMLGVHQHSRVVASALHPTAQLLSARQVAELAVELWQAEAGGGALEVGTDIELVYGDRSELARILVGLGRLARAAGGSPRVEAEVTGGRARYRAVVGSDPDPVEVLVVERLARGNGGAAWRDGAALLVELAVTAEASSSSEGGARSFPPWPFPTA